MFEITRCDSRTAIDTCKEAGLPAEHGRPLLEVRRCGDGHPPVTERERVIRLNGIGGVTLQTRIESFDPGFFTLTTFVIPSEAKNLGLNFCPGSLEPGPEMFRFAQHDNMQCERLDISTNLKIHAHH